MNNRIYFFTGTGNSLKVAQDIAAAIPECEIMAICKGMDLTPPTGYERIGFVYPVYFGGLPDMVANFIKNAHFTKDSAKYYFAVATPGGFAGNPIYQAKSLFAEKGLSLNYGVNIHMSANYVLLYDMYGFLINPPLKAYGKHIKGIVSDIQQMNKRLDAHFSKTREDSYIRAIATVNGTDYAYNVSDACVSCGICRRVCPAKNITLDDGHPVFHHQCECCMACIQHCPHKAINYKSKTQKRKRYTHPDIGYAEISRYYENASKV